MTSGTVAALEDVVDGLIVFAVVTVVAGVAGVVPDAVETFCKDLMRSSRRVSASTLGGSVIGSVMGSIRSATTAPSGVGFSDFLVDGLSILASTSLRFFSL